MKQSLRNQQSDISQEEWHQKMQDSQVGRYEMNGFVRILLLIVLLILIAAVALANLSVYAHFPLVARLQTAVFSYQRSCSIDYAVLTRANTFSDETRLGMDQTYLRDYVDAVEATLNYDLTGDRPASLAWKSSLIAEVQVRDDADPSRIILRKAIALQPEQTGESVDGTLHVQQSARLNLADYEAIAESFSAQPGVHVRFVLAVKMTVQLNAALPVENLARSDETELLIPLGVDQFQITRTSTGSISDKIVQPVRYQLILPTFSFPAYPIAAGLLLVLLVLMLAVTRNRRGNRYRRQLRRMIRRARSRLLLIADKAWEPEWCIAIADFSSLVRTARKLKHPIFCYINQDPGAAAAYFYIYFGENNYCYTLADMQGLVEQPASQKPAPAVPPTTPLAANGPETVRKVRAAGKVAPHAEAAAAQAVTPIPLLPESDDDQEIT
jgi:hypothetical protein